MMTTKAATAEIETFAELITDVLYRADPNNRIAICEAVLTQQREAA